MEGKNEGRIEYLRAMIKTSKIIKPNNNQNEVGIFDKVTMFFEDENDEEVIQLSTTMQNDASKGIISKESPLGKAIMGKKTGDRACVKVSEDYSYSIVIRSIIKGGDDKSLEIRKF